MIPITKPYFGKEERLAVQRPLETGWVVQGPEVERFERLFADFTGAPHAVATSSCTTALHIAVAALGLKPGDEVIVPAFTWVATANCVEYMGATPVFVDVDLRTFNLDPAQLEARITPRTVGSPPASHGPLSRGVSVTIIVWLMPPVISRSATPRSWPNAPAPGAPRLSIAASAPTPDRPT